MRTAKEVYDLTVYAKKLTTKLDEHNKRVTRTDIDKFNKKFEVISKVECYTGVYGDSSISSSLPTQLPIFDTAVSSYLTENFDDVINYVSRYIIKDLKKDINALEKQQEELTETIKLIKESF